MEFDLEISEGKEFRWVIVLWKLWEKEDKKMTTTCSGLVAGVVLKQILQDWVKTKGTDIENIKINDSPDWPTCTKYG